MGSVVVALGYLDSILVEQTKELKPVDNSDETVDNDFKYARENLYNIIERGSDALNTLVDVANQSQHPRAYEVVGQLIKTLTDTNDKIVDMQAKAKDILSDPKKDGPDKVTNNLFVGTNADLTKLLGGNAREQLLKDDDKR